MVAFVLCSLALMFLGWFGLQISGAVDMHVRRRYVSHWYDTVLVILMVAGALCAVGGLIVLAWKFLP